MIFKKQKKLNKILLLIFLIICLLTACKIQKEVKVNRIIKGINVDDFSNYIYSNDTNSVYITQKDTFIVRSISEYDNKGNLIKFSIYKSEGVIEYSIEELMKDTSLFKFTGGKSMKNWQFIDDITISNNIDTLKIETSKNTHSKNILINIKGNYITIFE